MKIIVNSEEQVFDEGITLLEVVKFFKIEEKVMALAVNMQIVKKDKWKEYIVQDGDRLEMLQFVGGG
jgi:sulfur carrier protein